MLTAVWPNRYATQAELRAGMVIYADLLGDINDVAWLAACRSAATTCRFFPVPAELIALAEESAEGAYLERVQDAEQQRIGAAHADIRRLLTAGTVTEEQADQHRQRYDRMVSDTLLAIREAGERTRRDRRHQWLHERHASRNRRIADGHWDAPPPATPHD